MGLSGSLFASQFTYISPSASPASATLRAGFQYTLLTRGEDIRRTPGVVIRDVLNNAPNTAEFTVDGEAPVPAIGEKIEIRDKFDDDRRLFGGVVQSVEMVYEGLTTQLAYRVHCVDYTWLANRKRPFGTYTNVSVSTIVKDLIAKFAPDFTTAHVQTNLAKVSATFDGSKDLATCLSDLATAIGGGHWYFDYDMDLHFFHIVPASLQVPPSAMPPSTAFMTVAEAGLIPAGKLFEAGYYLFRHTFIYNDGSESSFQMVSNLLRCTGQNILSFTGVPTGTPAGTAQCVGRRIYYNKFVTGYPGGDPIEKINGFLQINDNTTTSFTTWFGAQGASVGSIVALGSVKTYSTPLVAAPGMPAWVLLSDQAAVLNLTGAISNGVYGNPNGVKLAPPASSGGLFAGGTGAVPSGWTVGSTIYWFYTRSNSNGETTAGPTGSTTLTSSGIRFRAPLPTEDPNIGLYLNLYISPDNVTFHRIGAGLAPGQGVNFLTPKNIWEVNFASFNPPSVNTAVVGIARGWVGYNGTSVMDESALLKPVSGGNIVYFASADVAAALEAAVDAAQKKPPQKAFNDHPAGPSAGPAGTVDTVSSDGYWNGGKFQFKVAYLYRDGSVSMPSPASPTIEKAQVNGEGVKGFNLMGIQTGPTVGGLDVVARFVYYCVGLSSNPNFSYSGSTPNGFVWPVPFNDPTWATPGGVIVVPDNTTTSLAQFSLADLGTTPTGGYAGLLVGRGNLPYGNANANAVSVDPIPMWPNPDGPSLEDMAPPQDIDNSNTMLLREGAGEPFSVSTDASQVRNRVYVIGAGSVTTQTATAGATQIFIADIASFSPHGGTVKYDDPGTGEFVKIAYTGVAGIPGQTSITLSKPLDATIPQGANIANFFQADDVESQKLMAKAELDANGRASDGVHEYTIVDGSLKAVFQLFMRAYAELELYSKPIVTIRYSTRDPLTRSGQTVHVDLTSPPCLGDFLIQEVTIDQFHDESDALSPRYTVTASSVRFDLNDLLLRIVSGQIGGGGAQSFAGIVPTATTTAADASVSGAIPVAPISLRRFSLGVIRNGSLDTSVSAGLQAGLGSTGSSVVQNDTAPIGGVVSEWVRFTPVNLNGNLCGYKTTGQAKWDRKPKGAFTFRTGPDLFGLPVGNDRCYWVGLFSANAGFSGGSDVMTTPHMALVAKNQSGGGGGWATSCLTSGNGTTQVISNRGFFPILPNTHYRVVAEALSNVAGVITIWDLTRGTQASVNFTFGSYGNLDIPGTTNDEFNMYCYGSATNSAVGTNTWIDINAGYIECD
jgi:hypothetical protein